MTDGSIQRPNQVSTRGQAFCDATGAGHRKVSTPTSDGNPDPNRLELKLSATYAGRSVKCLEPRSATNGLIVVSSHPHPTLLLLLRRHDPLGLLNLPLLLLGVVGLRLSLGVPLLRGLRGFVAHGVHVCARVENRRYRKDRRSDTKTLAVRVRPAKSPGRPVGVPRTLVHRTANEVRLRLFPQLLATKRPIVWASRHPCRE